jgi:hypothetical protein
MTSTFVITMSPNNPPDYRIMKRGLIAFQLFTDLKNFLQP